MKRLTLDLPEGLHRAIKHCAVEESVTRVEMLRTLLEAQYGAGSHHHRQCWSVLLLCYENMLGVDLLT
jgi:nitroreductase